MNLHHCLIHGLTEKRECPHCANNLVPEAAREDGAELGAAHLSVRVKYPRDREVAISVPRGDGCKCPPELISVWLEWSITRGITDNCRCGKTVFDIPDLRRLPRGSETRLRAHDYAKHEHRPRGESFSASAG